MTTTAMTTVEQQQKIHDKIVNEMDKVCERLIAFKKQKNSELVMIRDNKIVKIKPE